MRTVIQPQLKFGETDIAAIVLNPKSRDDIPQLLRGLQHIYTDIVRRKSFCAKITKIICIQRIRQAKTFATINTSLRQRFFALLEEV